MNENVHVVYRISELTAAGAKEKLPIASKLNCLTNFVNVFRTVDMVVLADSVSNDFFASVHEICPSSEKVYCGSGGSSFRYAANLAMSYPSNDVVYLVEDDYLHLPHSPGVLLDGFAVGSDYVTLYDHPDKYVDKRKGGNPLVRYGGELTRVKLGATSHWKVTNSTTMTFATRVSTLRADWSVFLKYCGGAYTDDYRLFRHLSRWNRRRLSSSIPGCATHVELSHLSPLVDWEKFMTDDRAVGFDS